MLHPNKRPSFFPTLQDEEEAAATEWLFKYLRIVIRIVREKRDRERNAKDSLSS